MTQTETRLVREMKKFSIILILMLSCIFLCSCGKSGDAAYLSEEERSSIEQMLAESITVYYDPEYPQSGELLLENPLDDTLTDLIISRSGSNMSITYLTTVPGHTKVRSSAYLSDSSWDKLQKNEGIRYQLDYTIGAYSYSAEDIILRIEPKSEVPVEELKIMIEVQDEVIPLEWNKKMEFSSGNEINGLTMARIYSLNGSASYSSGENVYSSVTIEVDGKKPDKGNLVYKLLDEDDVVWASGDISFYSGDIDKIYIYEDLVPGITYTLLFEEIK